MPVLVIHGVSNRQGAKAFRQEAEMLLAPCNIPGSDIIPVYWGDYASKLSFVADKIKCLPPRWNPKDRTGVERELVSFAPGEIPALSISPLISYYEPLTGEEGLVTPSEVRERLATRGLAASAGLIDEPLGVADYASFQAIEAVDLGLERARQMESMELPDGEEPPLPGETRGGIGLVDLEISAPRELFDLGKDNLPELEEKIRGRLEELIAEGLTEGAGKDYSRGLLNINLKKIIGDAIAGLVGALVVVGGWAWAVKWLVRKLWDKIYAAWLKDWVKSLMRRLNDKLMGILDALLNGLHRRALPMTGNFLGDVFVYLRGERREIQNTVSRCYDEARQRQKFEIEQGRKSQLYILAHSLGGLLAYDLVINRDGQLRGDDYRIDKLITFGSQVGLFHEIDPASTIAPDTEDMVDLSPYLKSWLNVYNELDPLAFSVNRIFRIGRKDSGNLREESIAYTGLITTSVDGAVVQLGVDFKAESDPHTGYWKDDQFSQILADAMKNYPRSP